MLTPHLVNAQSADAWALLGNDLQLTDTRDNSATLTKTLDWLSLMGQHLCGDWCLNM